MNLRLTLFAALLPLTSISAAKNLPIENLTGDGTWVSPLPLTASKNPKLPIVAKVWFDKQFLGDGKAYLRRAKELSETGIGRRELRSRVISSLQNVSANSHAAAKVKLDALLASKAITDLKPHWIINGFTCQTTVAGIDALKEIPGVKKIFISQIRRRAAAAPDSKKSPVLPAPDEAEFNTARYKYPWYIHSLMADRVWSEFGVTGKGTLNIIQDGNFLFPENLVANVYRNPNEIPGNGEDDDKNGLVDDVNGFDFTRNSAVLTTSPAGVTSPQVLHGTMCAAIICGAGTEKSPYQFGIAPEGKWAGVIAYDDLESAVEWAVLHEADTYSMSFSIPNLGEMRSHWRKVMEQGSFCGIYFVSGAGNFAQTVKTPVQMRIPENIPEVVFAAAGVQRDLSRTPFSSKGPVLWKTEHYDDGEVQKPEVCAFNYDIPTLFPDGKVQPGGLNGNSFAGPMFCGSIALMLSADPDLLPWDLKEIITTTATDVGPDGIDFETGHGLINCYRAVKEILRRKAIRVGTDSAPFTNRSDNDSFDPDALRKQLGKKKLAFGAIQKGGAADKAGIQPGDNILTVHGMEVLTQADFISAIKSAKGKPAKIKIERGGEEREFELPPGNPGIARLRETYDAAVFRSLTSP